MTVRQPVVVIGIGSTMRRDDGVGPLALDVLRREPPPGCDIVELDGEAARVVEAWRDRRTAIVVDAVWTGAPAGTVHDLSFDEVEGAGNATRSTSSHSAGLGEAIALGRSLDRLPTELRVLGIEPGDLKRGFGLSERVSAAMDELVRRVRAAVLSAVGSPAD